MRPISQTTISLRRSKRSAITPAIASHLGDNRVAGITVLDIANGATGLIITKGLFEEIEKIKKLIIY